MKIRKLRQNKSDHLHDEPLSMVQKSLFQMEQSLNEHFIRTGPEDEGVQKKQNIIFRILDWFKALTNSK